MELILWRNDDDDVVAVEIWDEMTKSLANYCADQPTNFNDKLFFFYYYSSNEPNRVQLKRDI